MIGSSAPRARLAVALAAFVAVVMLSPTADAATPPARKFTKPIEALSKQYSEEGCSSPKTGTKALAALIEQTYPKHVVYMTRSCSAAGVSGHESGRAIDFMVNSNRSDVQSFINWLLATDSSGNKYAMARRLGVQYLIYNKRIWRPYRGGVWGAYTGSNPHTDHLHISLNPDGANKKTSFWSGTITSSSSSKPASSAKPAASPKPTAPVKAVAPVTTVKLAVPLLQVYSGSSGTP